MTVFVDYRTTFPVRSRVRHSATGIKPGPSRPEIRVGTERLSAFAFRRSGLPAFRPFVRSALASDVRKIAAAHSFVEGERSCH